MTAGAVARPEPAGLVALARDLESAAPSGDVLDLLAAGVREKPLSSATLCYTEAGVPAWDAPDATGLHRDALADRLDELGVVWRLTPVRSGTEDRRYTWYDLLVALPGSEGADYLGTAPGDPSRRDDRAYGRALGYPDSAVAWFRERTGTSDRSVFDVVRVAYPDEPAALAHAASVSYVPAPTPRGAEDAVEDGRELGRALCRLDRVADGDGYVRSLLAERVDGTLAQHGVTDAGVDDLAAPVPC